MKHRDGRGFDSTSQYKQSHYNSSLTPISMILLSITVYCTTCLIPCSLLLAPCNLPPAACCLLLAACSFPLTTCFFPLAACPLLLAPCCLMIGYTPNERRRFNEALQVGDLVDTYRYLNPVPATSLGEEILSHHFNEENHGKKGLSFLLFTLLYSLPSQGHNFIF